MMNEESRLATLRAMNILDTDPEQPFDDLVQLAASIANTPIALFSLVDENRQWFKACVGLGAKETPRSHSFCAHAINAPDAPFVIEDALEDPRFANNPLVTGEPRIRFYAGIPIRDRNSNQPLGTICVISPEPGMLTDSQIQALQRVGREVENQLWQRTKLPGLAGDTGGSFVKGFRNLRVLVPVLGLLLATLAASWSLRQSDQQRMKAIFIARTQNPFNGLRENLLFHEQSVTMLSAMFEANPYLTRGDFKAIAQSQVAGASEVQALEWIPLVSHSERASMEAAARADGLANFAFKQWQTDGTWRGAQEKWADQYAPVYYVYPLEGNQAAAGIDLASNPSRLAALNEAKVTGKPVSTARITLAQASTSQAGVLLFAPVYEASDPEMTHAERQERLIGFALGVFRIGSTIESVLNSRDVTGLHLRVLDISNADTQQQELYRSADWQPAASPQWQSTMTHTFGGRDWQFEWSYDPAYVASQRSDAPWMALLSGLCLTGVMGFVLNRNSQKEFEASESLKQLESQTGALRQAQYATENSSDAVFWIRQDGSFSYANRQAANFLGYSQAELCCMTVSDINPDYPLEAWPGHWDETKQLGVLTFESAHQRKDGSKYDCRITKHYLELDDEVFIFATVQDITEQKATAMRLQESAQTIRGVFDNTQSFLGLLSLDGTLVEANDRAIAATGQSREQIIGKPFWETPWWTHSPELQERLKQAICEAASGAADNFEATHPAIDGSDIIVDFYLTPIYVDDQVAFLLPEGRDITQQQKADRDLYRSRAALDNSNDAVFWTKKDGSFLYVNDTACRQLGYTRDDLLQLTVADIDADVPSAEVFESELWPKLLAERSSLLSMHHQRKDGTTFPVEVMTTVIDVGDEAIVCANVRDITERHQAKLAVEESEQRFRALANSASPLSWITELDSSCSWLNERWFEYCGRSEESQLGHGWVDTVHPDDREPTKAAYLAAFDKREPFTLEYRLRRHDGAYRWFTVNATPRFDRDGKFVGYVGMSFDIHEVHNSRVALEQSEAALQKTAYQLEQSLVNGNVGLWDWDLTNNSIDVSDSFRLLLKFKGEFTYQDFVDGLHTEDRDETLTALRAYLDRQVDSFDVRFRIRRGDGSYRWVHSRARATFGNDGTPQRMIGVITDVDELVTANRLLESSNKELEQFAYVASHDLQEPLRKVTSFCNLLSQEYGDRIDGDGAEYLDFVQDGATRMRTLVQDLLQYSRIMSQGRPLRHVSVADALQGALLNLEMAVVESQAIIAIDDLPPAWAEPQQLTQLFQNLIGNAIKYRSDRRPEIHVGIVRSNRGLVYFVRDNGIGMEPEYCERIFGIFKRLHTRAEYSGTGIGLAICKRIVERFQGRIWAEAQPNVGSTFYFTLNDNLGETKAKNDEPSNAATY